MVALPPLALLLALLKPSTVLGWLFPWVLVQMLLPPRAASLSGHALSAYVAYVTLDDELAGVAGSHSRLAAALTTGLIMGITYRNCFRALRWLVSGIDRDDMLPNIPSHAQQRRGALSLPPPRAPSALIPLPESTSSSAVEMVVRVSLPTVKTGRGLVCNERRTVEAYVDFSDAPGIATLAHLIASEGGDGGVKAYFKARREVGQLRIFVDRVLPQPAQW